jgi:y4mF family transcriptional regulator
MQVRSTRDLGATIKGARQRHGYTQAQLAERAGVTRQWIISVEKGKSTAEVGAVLRTLAALELVADVVDDQPRPSAVHLDSLVGGNG